MIAILKTVAIVTAALALGTFSAAVVAAEPIGDQPVAPGGPDLKTTLEKGLRARRRSEVAFIERVVDRVNAGALPIKVVETDFLWARRRQPWPMPYFERAMRLHAKRLGVSLD